MKIFKNFYNFAIAIIFGLVIVGGSYVGYKTWTLGGDEEDYEVICLFGQEYLRANFAYKGLMANHLDGDGKPIKCIAKK